MFWKKEIRNYLLEEYAQEDYLMKNHTVPYTQGERGSIKRNPGKGA